MAYFQRLNAEGVGTMRHARTVIQSRWDLTILRGIGEGLNRPALLLRHYPQMPRRTFYRRLKHLMQAGLIEPAAQPPQKTHGGVRPTILRLTEQGERWRQALQRLEAAGLSAEQILYLCPMLQCPCRLRSLELLLHQPTRPRVLVLGLRVKGKLVFEHLKRLQRLRVVHRKVIPSRPVQVRYELTPQGEKIARALLEARQLLADELPLVVATPSLAEGI
ncbi:MAG: winged helix-turn-helix transcriptional regulator [Armatimonadota bacterium]|nr:winged helix-turn-helix transcriptional regulator [Armatimonadota bacterium]MDT7973361.1 winged helix-turn-helix transcriptional regulator [Armatimonadota bacterium]